MVEGVAADMRKLANVKIYILVFIVKLRGNMFVARLRRASSIVRFVLYGLTSIAGYISKHCIDMED